MWASPAESWIGNLRFSSRSALHFCLPFPRWRTSTSPSIHIGSRRGRTAGTQERPSRSLRQAGPKNGHNLFNASYATEPVRVRLQQLQTSRPDPTSRALFLFRLANALSLSSLRQLRLRLRLWAAPSSLISRTSSRSKPQLLSIIIAQVNLNLYVPHAGTAVSAWMLL